MLEPLGCRVVTAGSGQEALKLLLDEQFALILLDVQMPDMDGFETASYIRDRQRTRTIPIIFLSAVSTSADHVFRGYEAGAVDYIVKPLDPVAIRSKVRVFLELHERGEEIRRQAEILRRRISSARSRRSSAAVTGVPSCSTRSRSRSSGGRTSRGGSPSSCGRASPRSPSSRSPRSASTSDGRAPVAFALRVGRRPRRARPVPAAHDGVACGDDELARAARARGRRGRGWLEVVPETFGERVWKRARPGVADLVPAPARGPPPRPPRARARARRPGVRRRGVRARVGARAAGVDGARDEPALRARARAVADPAAEPPRRVAARPSDR